MSDNEVFGHDYHEISDGGSHSPDGALGNESIGDGASSTNSIEILIKAVKKNLNVLCYDCKFSSKGIKLNRKINIKLNE